MVLVIKTVMLLLPEAIASSPFPITIILSWIEVTASSFDFLSWVSSFASSLFAYPPKVYSFSKTQTWVRHFPI